MHEQMRTAALKPNETISMIVFNIYFQTQTLFLCYNIEGEVLIEIDPRQSWRESGESFHY